jgi:hypothetical protein
VTRLEQDHLGKPIQLSGIQQDPDTGIYKKFFYEKHGNIPFIKIEKPNEYNPLVLDQTFIRIDRKKILLEYY